MFTFISFLFHLLFCFLFAFFAFRHTVARVTADVTAEVSAEAISTFADLSEISLFCYFLFLFHFIIFSFCEFCFYSHAKPSARQPWPKLALVILGQLSLQVTSGSEQKKLCSPHAMRNHVLRLFCLFNSITSGPLYFFIVMFHFIVFLVPIYYSFVFALFHIFSYVTLFTINTSVIILQKRRIQFLELVHFEFHLISV